MTSIQKALRAAPPLAADSVDVSFAENALSTLVRLFDRLGDAFVVRSPALGRRLLVLSHPDHVRRILVDNHANYRKGVGIDRVAILLGNGIMTSEGETWRTQRKMIQPAFHRRLIAGYVARMHAANERVAAKWEAAARAGMPVNVTQDMSQVTLEIILRALFGDDLDRLVNAGPENPFALLTEETGRDLLFASRFRSLSSLIFGEVERRRQARQTSHDLVSMLLEANDRRTGDPMPDRQLLDEILTLIIAGHETTASALNWFWWLLAQHPEAEARLHAELAANADAGIVAPGHADLERYPYTLQALSETLRLYPPGWLLTRRAIAADTIAGTEVEAGTDILLSPYLIHRHPGFWEAPDRFDPDRFAPGAIAARNRFAYLPFGLGPRACIGEHFAVVEMQIHVAMLARRFRLVPVPDQRVEPEAQVNLRTRHPVFMFPQLRTE
jgi:enediyne biosynthesis protein E7